MSRLEANFPPPPDLTPYLARISSQYVAGGSFGDVYRCWYHDGSPKKEVAIKAFRFTFPDGDTNRLAKMLRRELGVWRRLDHVNVVPFLGVAYGFGMHDAMSLVSLWMRNGSLHHFLNKHPDVLTIQHRLKFLLDIANGLGYLHSLSIIHGDLNCNNVLLDADYTARVADFGYASLVGNIPEALTYLQRTTTHSGALRWSAPEQIKSEEKFNRTTKSDIYSFGCIALEVLSGKPPWSEIQEDMAVVFRLATGCRPGRPPSPTLNDSHWDFIQQCWSSTEERPAAEVIVSVVGRFLGEYPGVHSLSDVLSWSSWSFSPCADDMRPEVGVEQRTESFRTDKFPTGSGPSPMPTQPHPAAQPVGPPGMVPRNQQTGVRKRKRVAPTTLQGSRLPPLPSAHAPYPPGPGDPASSGPTEQSQTSSSLAPVNSISNGGQFPDDLHPHSVPPELKTEGSDWSAIFNPRVTRVLDVTLVHTLMHESVVCCVRFSADGKFLATGCHRTAQIYDTKTGAKTCVLFHETARKAGDLYIRSVCFSPDGKFLATGADDKQVRIWDIAKKRIRSVFDGHQQEVYSLDISLDGRLIVSGSGDQTVRIWDMVDGSSKVLTVDHPYSLNKDAGVCSVAVSLNGQLVAAGCLDTVVRVWDVATGLLVERLRGHKDSVYSIAFTPDGEGLVSGSLDKTLKYWDISGLVNATNSRCTMNFIGHTDYVLSVAVSHDGKWVVSGSKDRGVHFWDSHTATVQCMLQGHESSVISVDLSPAGNILATGSGDWQARIWRY